MAHIRKMAVVPQSMLDKLFSAQSEQQQLTSDTPMVQLSLLDQELKKVLEGNEPADVKAKHYAQVLHTYSNIRDKEVHRGNPFPPPSRPQKDVLAGLAQTYINKGKMLMDHLSQVPDLKWNDKNEIIYRDAVIPGSNIIDLVHSFAKPKTKYAPSGWKEFSKILTDTNVPKLAVGNQDLLNDATLAVDLFATPTSERSSSTPRKPKRTRRAKIPWTPY